MKASVISIDLAKNIFQLCALNRTKKVICNVKVGRADLLNQLILWVSSYSFIISYIST